MRCPVCRSDQLIVEVEGVELDVCIEGHGVWFDADEIHQLFAAAGVPESLQDLEERLLALSGRGHGPVRRCPRCAGRMKKVQAPGAGEPVVLDRCARGHGVWFDEGELEQVLRAELEEGDESLARVLSFLKGYGTTED
jgi:Zn-finger nucleic acid-binding protein